MKIDPLFKYLCSFNFTLVNLGVKRGLKGDASIKLKFPTRALPAPLSPQRHCHYTTTTRPPPPPNNIPYWNTEAKKKHGFLERRGVFFHFLQNKKKLLLAASKVDARLELGGQYKHSKAFPSIKRLWPVQIVYNCN